MKRIALFLAGLVALVPLFGADIEPVAYSNLVAGISRARSPVVSGKYIIFTARGTARYTGISFDHEQYRTVWPFKRIVRKDEKGEPVRDETGKPLENVLFYIAEVPPETTEIRYRMVIDGLWTTDPLNPSSAYDYANGMMVSTLAVDRYEVFTTSIRKNTGVRFACISEPGKTVRLAGSFNNWDPFMYEMTETKDGYYELALPLPAGTWYYAYFTGTEQIPDSLNPDRVYTKDGRVASVIEVR